jgi:DNA-binding CsgD family transcriptional regulator
MGIPFTWNGPLYIEGGQMGESGTPGWSAVGGLVGREQELGFIRSFLSHAALQGGSLIVFGEAGSGKTAILDAAADFAAKSGTQHVRATGVEFEAEMSFSALNQSVLPLMDDFELLTDAHRTALGVALGLDDGPTPDMLLVSNAVFSLLQHVGSVRPLLVTVDDLQWVDRSSAVVLGFVARRLEGTRVGFVAASRLGVESFFDYNGLPERTLRALDDQAAANLLSVHFPEIAPQVSQRILAESAGNPLALLELPRELSSAERAAHQDLPGVLRLGRRLQSIFESRISGLPPETRQILLLAVLDGTGDLRLLQKALPDHLVTEGLAPAERRQLVLVDENAYRLAFRHPLIRSAIVGLSASSERLRAHRSLAEALDDQPDRQAWHLAEATDEPEERVAELLYQSAQRRFRRGDSVGAVAALTRSADLSPHQTDRSCRLLEAAYLGANVTGGLRSTQELLDEARKADPQLSGSLYAAATSAYLLLNGEGHIDTIHRLLVGAIEDRDAVAHVHDQSCADALGTLFLVCMLGRRPELWESFFAALNRLGPNAPTELYLLSQLMSDPVRLGTRRVLDELDQAIGGLDKNVNAWSVSWLSSAAVSVDRLAGCRDAMWRVIQDGRQGGAVALAINASQQLSLDDFATGQWEEAEQLAEESLELCQTHGNQLMEWIAFHRLGLVAAGRGEVETCRQHADRITRWAVPRGMLNAQENADHVRILSAVGEGEFELAYQYATRLSPPGILPSYVPLALHIALDLVESAVRTNHLPQATAHVTAMHEAGVSELSVRMALIVGGCSAIVAPDSQASNLFEAALTITGASRWQFDFARIQLCYGERLRRVRSIVESREHLAAALDAFTRMGARPWAIRAETELGATARNKMRSSSIGLGFLTPQEREVATLAASGLTNKEIGERIFLSHRTVGAHLYRVFPKLGITSRAALRDALMNLDDRRKA